MRKSNNHMYIIGTVGFAFGLALLLDALYGNSNHLVQHITNNAQINHEQNRKLGDMKSTVNTENVDKQIHEEGSIVTDTGTEQLENMNRVDGNHVVVVGEFVPHLEHNEWTDKHVEKEHFGVRIPIESGKRTRKGWKSKNGKYKSRDRTSKRSRRVRDIRRETHTNENINDTYKKPNYLNQYRDKQNEDKVRKDQPIIDGINANAYRGNGSRNSQRQYLIQQAYQASRELTPVRDIGSANGRTKHEDDELMKLVEDLELSDEDEDEDLVKFLEDENTTSVAMIPPPPEPKPTKQLEFSKQEWEEGDQQSRLQHYIAGLSHIH